MFTISPSIYSANFLNLKEVLDNSKSFEHIHLDIDDGNFVRGISFGIDLVKQIASYTDVELDAHLEVMNPMEYVKDLCEANVSLIVAHIEVLDFPNLFLSSVHKYGKKAGLSLNLKTPVVYIKPYVNQIDHLLFVSVEADVEGLPFRRSVLEKIKEARQIVGKDLPIWVDGGVNETNLKEIIEAGASGVVIGRAVYGQNDYKKAYKHLIELGRSYEKEMSK